MKKTAIVYQENCVACGACLKVCPKKALSIFHGCHAAVNTSLCVGCWLCGKICPANAIKIQEQEASA